MRAMQIPEITFERALAHFGRSADMARAFGVSRASVAEWRAANRLPPLRALQFTQLLAERERETERAA